MTALHPEQAFGEADRPLQRRCQFLTRSHNGLYQQHCPVSHLHMLLKQWWLKGDSWSRIEALVSPCVILMFHVSDACIVIAKRIERDLFEIATAKC